LKTKRREEERRERKEKEGRGERGEREKKRQQTALLNGPSAARAYGLCSFARRCSTMTWIVFIFFAQFSYVGGAFLLSLLASAAKCIQKLFYTKKMAEFAHSEPDSTS
jgi:hypothetical protein